MDRMALCLKRTDYAKCLFYCSKENSELRDESFFTCLDYSHIRNLKSYDPLFPLLDYSLYLSLGRETIMNIYVGEEY